MKAKISICISVLWMCVIFSMSAQPADVSGDLSGTISHLFVQVVNAILGCGWDEMKLLQLATEWDYPIRKLAHMSEFGILALIYKWTIETNAKSSVLNKTKTVMDRIGMGTTSRMALVGTLLYAATDEFHQLFVPGRAGLITDVMIDTLGAGMALLLCYAATGIRRALQK